MWLIAGGAAVCASWTMLESWIERLETSHAEGLSSASSFFRRDDGVFVDVGGVPVDEDCQERLCRACGSVTADAV